MRRQALKFHGVESLETPQLVMMGNGKSIRLEVPRRVPVYDLLSPKIWSGSYNAVR